MLWKKVVNTTVLITDTGDLVKYTKVIRETILKELGKMTQ
jgi:hypothetical protein